MKQKIYHILFVVLAFAIVAGAMQCEKPCPCNAEMLICQTVAGGLTITQIAAHFTIKIENTNENSAVQGRITTEGATSVYGDYENITTSYQEFTYVVAANPDDDEAWEKTDLDGLSAGVRLGDVDNIVRLTNVFVRITYSNESTEDLYPDSDVVTNAWTDAVGGDDDGDLFDEVDEVGSDGDTTYIGNATDFQAVTFGLGNPT